MRRIWILLAAALILSAVQTAEAQDDALLKAFYERYYQPVSINEYSVPDLAAMWGEMKRFHADCAEITRERMKLAVVSMTADRLASIALSIPDNPWEAKSLLNLLGASSNVHQLLEDLGLVSVGEGQSWLYRQLGYVGWIAALHGMGGTLQSMEGWWSLRRIGELSRGGLSPAQLKDLLNIELFALSVADELLDRLVVGQVRSTFRLDKMRVMLHSMCYSMASELEGLYRKAADRTLSHIEALALMALERDYLAKNVDIFALEMEYWRKEAEGWSPLDLLSWYGDEDRDRAMLELNRQKYETTKEHYQRWDHYITAVLGSLEGAASGEETYVGEEEVEEIPAVEEDYEIVGDESHERDRDRLLLERGAMSRAEYERKWGGGEAATGGGVRYEAEVAPGQFSSPDGIDIGPDGSIYVVDAGHRCVQRFSSSGAFIQAWGAEGEGDGRFENPNDIAVAPDGSVYVVDYWGKDVQKFTADGRFLRSWSHRGGGEGELSSPTGIDVAGDGTVFVLDGGNLKIYHYTADGGLINSFGGWDHFTYNPEGLEVGPDGNVYACNSGGREVKRFTPAGGFVLQWGEDGNDPGQFNQPLDLAFAPDGSVVVIDCKPRVQRFSAEGNLLGYWGEEGEEPGRLGCSGGIAINSDGVLFISDPFDDRVQMFTLDGRFLGLLGGGR
ncbi:MAG TPA: NHL repeat-containing protein [Acidobacteriota bacterium]|nr:NHL repeat-containing protein [Acidobacteriota bacterium]